MLIDTISIIIISILVIVAILSNLANPFLRKIELYKRENLTEEELPKVTVLVLTGNNAEDLDNHLSIILTQDYKPGYEVVVVGEKGDIQTEAVLKNYASSNLYATYIPQHSLFMSKKKLAVAIGVKAAHNEWIVLIDGTCKPVSDTWLKTMATHMDETANLVLGYSNYDDSAKASYRFERLRKACYILRKAVHGIAYCSCGTNIAFRRSEFIENDGYRGNLQLINGEYDFIVNKYARKGATRIAIEQNATVREKKPSSKKWHSTNMQYINSLRYMQRSLGVSIMFSADMALMYASYILDIMTIVYSTCMQNYLLLGFAVVTLLCTLTLRTLMVRKKIRQFKENISVWASIPRELAIIWHRLTDVVRYILSDKYEFTTHKI